MKFRLLIISFIVINSSCLISQDSITVKDIREINIEVLKKLKNFEKYLYEEYIEFIDEGLLISNDLYADNAGNKIIKIEDYFQNERLTYKNKPKAKFNILNIDIPVKSGTYLTDSKYVLNVKVQKIIPQGEVLCDSKSIVTPADTLIQLISFEVFTNYDPREKSSNDNSNNNLSFKRWILLIKKIKTIDPKGVLIEFFRDTNQFSSLFKESYSARYGMKCNIIDSVYSFTKEEFNSNLIKYNPIFFLVKDLSKPIKINDNLNFSNYQEMFNSNKKLIEKNDCIKILKIPIKEYSKIGYFEAYYGLSFLNKSTSSFSYENNLVEAYDPNIDFSFGKLNQRYGLDYHLFLPNKMVINIGLMIMNNNFSFSNNVNSFSENYSSVDVDGSSYNRQVSYDGFNETYDLSYLSIGPRVGLDYEIKSYKLSSVKHSFLNLSFNYSLTNMTCNSAISNRVSTIAYSGTYSDFFNITISENGVYDFGVYQIEKQKIQEKKVNNLSHNFSAGLKFYPFKSNRLYIAANVNYMNFTKPLFQNNNNSRLSQNSNELNSFFSNTSLSNLNLYSFSMQIGGWISSNSKYGK